MTDSKILVLGAGSIGGYFGGRLAETGADVTFLVREGRQAAIKRDGLQIESPYGNAKLAVKTALTADLTPDFDFVILTCKAYDLDSALQSIAPAIGPSTTILPLLNGVAHMELLNERFGKDCVLGGSAKIQANLSESGIVRQLNDWRFLTFGEQSGEMSKRVQLLSEMFAGAKGVVAEAVSDVMQRMWEKLVHLSTAASMTCLMRANVGEIVRTTDGAKLFLRLLATMSEIAASNGHRPSEAFSSTYREIFTDQASTYATSMLRDIERRGRTEVDHIIGFMLQNAKTASIEDETLSLAFTHVKAYEQRLAAKRDI